MKIYKKSTSELILLVLEKTIDGFVRVDDFINNPKRYAFGDPSSLKKSALSQALKRLREGGFIKEEEQGKEMIVKLTDLGKEALGPVFDDSKWDGKWRIVIFDIPEKLRIVRNLFRRRLKDWGFRIFQQSVWITKRDVTSKLNNLIRELRIDKWVIVIESDSRVFHNLMDGRPAK